MKSLHRSMMTALVSVLALAGCANQPDVDTKDLEEHTAAAEPVVVDAAVRVEQAERSLDVGRDVAGARATLEAVVADKSAPADVRDRAALSLSRALEMSKDKEGAITTVEKLLASHSNDPRWAGQEAAERRLRKLLTGKEEGPGVPFHAPEAVPPFAKVLAKYYPIKKGEPTDVSLATFGGDRQASERLGTFNVGAALHEAAEEACQLCDDKLAVRGFVTMWGSWTEIPKERARLNSSLAVFYTHLADPIPSRYEELLPVPMAEVLPHLQKGEGIVVSKERAGAPPVILIAAPREAQLAEVEEALSMMKAMPGTLTVIKLNPSLKSGEIKGLMHKDAMPEFKKCYESLLTSAPAAAGKVVLAFAIKGDGTVEDLKVETVDATGAGFDDPTFQKCMTDATGKLHFEATGTRTTVKYPMSFAP